MTKMALLLLALGLAVAAAAPPVSSPTRALVWPQPTQLLDGGAPLLAVSSASFTITTSGGGPLLAAAAQRYRKGRIFVAPPLGFQHQRQHTISSALGSLAVSVASPNETLGLGVDESYSLDLQRGTLAAGTVFGALRGLETFAQLVSTATKGSFVVPPVQIVDRPRFSYRGILVDTARHFINVTRLQDIIDAMEIIKLNVLQLHMTDDQSFPFGSTTHPNITRYGAFNAQSVFSHGDLQALSAYAKARGVWIQVELDLPAHSASWKGAYDFAWCSQKAGQPAQPSASTHSSGLPNPTLASTFSLLADLYGELVPLLSAGEIKGRVVSERFVCLPVRSHCVYIYGCFVVGSCYHVTPCNVLHMSCLASILTQGNAVVMYQHLGGDEVERNCWTNDPAVQKWADAHGYRNDLGAWDCGNRSICSTECAFHVGQAQAALAAGFGSLYMWEDARGE